MTVSGFLKRCWIGVGKDDNIALLLSRAFPLHLAPDVEVVLDVLPSASREPTLDSFQVHVDGETVAIPQQIYCSEPSFDAMQSLTPTQRAIVNCLYTRHKKPEVRRRHAAELLKCTEPWVAPFILQLAGEGDVDVIRLIQKGLNLDNVDAPCRQQYIEFVRENPEFADLTLQSAATWWKMRYAKSYANFADYPTRQILDALRRAEIEPA